MGIESDQVVYEYLSRVGDVAQQRQLSSATRMRLVSELRNEIDRRRAKAAVDSPAAVRRIIDRLGSPDDIVAAAADRGGDAPQTPAPSVPVQRDREAEPERPKGIRRVVPRPRTGAPPPATPSDVASPPHRAPAHELGDGRETPDWWLNEPTPLGIGEDVPGFVGGVEIPDLLKPPRPRKLEEEREEEEAEAEVEGEAGEGDGRPRRRRFRVLRRSPSGERARWSNPLLLIAAGCLGVGAVLGNWFGLILGWLIAYASRRLTERETKFAVMGLPGLALTAGLVWLWGRSEGRWGDPIADGHMNDAVAQTWPWVIRGAAVASALFLVWRSQKPR
ncbi:DUF2157 domain-containing protein [Streptomyces asoensis]|uniref:DUF2157 domain-containing protein n=1 Tax=Streptomyces asoensis TaxID=249586 RepID=A0A6M4WPB1_9ACTN|nr:hypothetical protein [Streptomyces asoensis]QJT02457.1 DUF2157 domain-containing protein [Streptomyces asoensis]